MIVSFHCQTKCLPLTVLGIAKFNAGQLYHPYGRYQQSMKNLVYVWAAFGLSMWVLY